MFCALLGQDIRLAFTGPLVLWFSVCIGPKTQTVQSPFIFKACKAGLSDVSACEATETRWRLEILNKETREIILSKQG